VLKPLKLKLVYNENDKKKLRVNLSVAIVSVLLQMD
jgi:hypothetical protein